MNTEYQIAGLMSLSQKLIRVAAAASSAGAVMAIVYQKFHPVAVPSAGCTNLVAWRTKPPVTGMKADISPVLRATPHAISPIQMYPNKAPTGPAVAIAWPDARNSPVPYESVSLSTDISISSEKAYYHASDGNHVDVATTKVTSDLMCSPYRHIFDV